MLERSYTDLALRQAMALLAIDSPTGFTEKAAQWVQDAFAALGYDARRTVKGGVLIDLGGKNADDALLLEAHADTLGGMVAEIKGNGRLRLTNLGGMQARTTARPRTSGSAPGTAASMRARCSSSMPASTSTAPTATPSAAGTAPRSCWTRT